MRPGGYRGRSVRTLTGADLSVYNTLATYPGTSTHHLITLISGRPAEQIRDAVRVLKKFDLIYKAGTDRDGNILWRVKE